MRASLIAPSPLVVNISFVNVHMAQRTAGWHVVDRKAPSRDAGRIFTSRSAFVPDQN